ncbi:hypothetical protein NP493_1439g00019 [Ridgeia piscesae]|uniref:EGF-like domain-containing protein n=1 Tax=Ridgeia piscesae TaxID=27915 RepID=A0AAD9K3N3_RIDPI|nr:hypothetical protein NP493_1439g00019 [Ridgeia piscesae]
MRIPLGHQTIASPVYDPIEKMVYWLLGGCIKRAYINGTQEQIVWRSESYWWGRMVNSLAIDPVSRLVYYTGGTMRADIGSNLLASMTLDGRHHFLLVTSRTSSISSIALDPVTGTMYWTVRYGIDMAAMDGSQHHHLVNLYNTIFFGITIDAEGQRVYWCDGYGIESVAYDGSNRRQLIHNSNRWYFRGITLVGDTLYYTDQRYIWALNASESTPTAQQVGPKFIRLWYKIGGYNSHDYIHGSDTKNPCKENNGGCEYVCFPTPDGARCACPDGFGEVVGSKCVKYSGVVYDNFLLVSDPFRHSLHQINLVDDSVWRYPLTNTRLTYVVYDGVEMKMYLNEYTVVKRTMLNEIESENITPRYASGDIYRYSPGIAIDVLSRILYYTGSLKRKYAEERFFTGFIAAMTLDGQHHFLLVTMRNDIPRDVVVDPTKGLMYWRLGTNIETAAMDGTQRKVLVTEAGYSYGLSIYVKGQRLYWCNTKTIESASVDGSDRRVLLNTTDAPFFTTVLGEDLYFTDRRHVWKINLSASAPTIQQVGPAFVSLINGLAGFSSQEEIHATGTTNTCSNNNGGCKHVCFPTPKGPRCGCAEGFVLRETSSQCSMAVGMTSDNFLILADPYQGHFYQINLANDFVWRLPLSQSRISHVTYDPIETKLYWRSGSNIFKAHLNGTTRGYVSGYHYNSIAFDFVSRLVYEAMGNGIIASTLDNRHRFVVIITRHGVITDIALDPVRGMQYWKNSYYIESAAMDGTQRTLLTNTKINGRSYGLAVDSDGERLYWYNDETIESMAVNGSDRTVFLCTPNTIPHGITILGDILYYTDNRFIWSVDVSRPNTTRRQVGLASFSAIHHMSAYSRRQYEKGSHIVKACGLVNGTCKNIVFPTPAGIVHAFQEGYSFGISPTWSRAASKVLCIAGTYL